MIILYLCVVYEKKLLNYNGITQIINYLLKIIHYGCFQYVS